MTKKQRQIRALDRLKLQKSSGVKTGTHIHAGFKWETPTTPLLPGDLKRIDKEITVLTERTKGGVL